MNQNGRNVNPCNDQVVVDSTVMFYYVDQALAWSYMEQNLFACSLYRPETAAKFQQEWHNLIVMVNL